MRFKQGQRRSRLGLSYEIAAGPMEATLISLLMRPAVEDGLAVAFDRSE